MYEPYICTDFFIKESRRGIPLKIFGQIKDAENEAHAKAQRHEEGKMINHKERKDHKGKGRAIPWKYEMRLTRRHEEGKMINHKERKEKGKAKGGRSRGQ